jgi:general secretion pathway protein K
MNKISSQRGSAIIIALFIMSLAASMAVVMLSRSHIEIQRTQLILNADQANLLAQGSIDWAIEQLKNNAMHKKPDQLVDKLPMKSKKDKVNGFEIESTIEDMQANYNVNDLTNVENQKYFLRLIHAVEPEVNLSDATSIVYATHEWVAPTTNDKIDAWYAKQKPAYKSPHQPMHSISELRMVKGMTAAIYNKLLPYVTALPDTAPININTAPIMVFYTLSPNISKEAIITIDQKRKATPFTDAAAFMALDVAKNNQLNADRLTVTSGYFLVKTSVKVGQQETVLYTLLQRDMKKSTPDVTTLWQTKGTL